MCFTLMVLEAAVKVKASEYHSPLLRLLTPTAPVPRKLADRRPSL